MDIEYLPAEKPEDWPANARECDLDNIKRAVDNYRKNPGYRSKEVLISLLNDYDLNQTAPLGLYRITDYEVALINELYSFALRCYIPSLKCYLYSLVGQTARLQKNFAHMMGSVNEEDIRVEPYERGLCVPLVFYYSAYQAYTVMKDKEFADKIIEVFSDLLEKTLIDGELSAEKKEEAVALISSQYTTILNDLSYFYANKKESIWKFDRDELFRLFELEAKLIRLAKLNPVQRPLLGVLKTQISNYILKSRNNYNDDLICKYMSESSAESSYFNHEIWMNRIENLNDEREGHIIKELFEEPDWIEAKWVRPQKLNLAPERMYFVSSFAKSVNNDNMKDDYGSVLFGYKGDRIADLLSPLYERTLKREASADKELPVEIKDTVFSLVTAFDVIYDKDEAKRELNYLFDVIDLFDMNDEDKNLFLEQILQYWLLSVKDLKWSVEHERRYVLFLYPEYDYQEMEIDDDFLKLKTSLFIVPDFLIGNHKKKKALKKYIDNKRIEMSYRPYLFCHNCFNRDYDVVTGLEGPQECPICRSKDFEVVIPKQE